ncbi:MAG: sulfotransferase [Alphaproteobacteria bacterium]|nr:sulfotransferase [Alphaproteobacteria bacterium]
MTTPDPRLRDIQAAMRMGDVARAGELAERALATGLDHPHVLTLAAYRRMGAGDHAGALPLAERASLLSPRNIDALSAVGTCLMHLDRPGEAAAAFGKAIAIDAGDPQLHLEAGAALEAAKEYKRAVEEYERAFALDPANADAAARLAFLSSTRGDMVKAREAGLKALALDRRQAFASLAVALADIDAGAYEAARKRLEGVVAFPNVGRIMQALALNVMGDALDGMGRSGDAYAAYAQSGRMRHEIYLPETASAGETGLPRARRITDYMKRSTASWPGDGADKAGRGSRVKTHAFLVSFPRSGTTLLSHVLDAHPKIVSLDEKRTLADSIQLTTTDQGLDRLAAMGEDELEPLREAYWRRVEAHGFSGSPDVLVDKMPLYSDLLCLVARLFPQAKILFALRDPRDVVFSCFRRRFSMTRQNFELLTLESTSRYYDAIMGLSDIYRDKVPLPFFDTRHEDLVADFEGRTEALCDFLGVGFDAQVKDFAARARTRDIATPNAAAIGRGISRDRTEQWRAYAPHFEPVMPILKPWIARFGYPKD